MHHRRHNHRLFILVAAMLAAAGCTMTARDSTDSQALSPERSAAVKKEVRNFMLAVAHDVTTEGPTAWQKEFADDPAFFMAVEGQMAFPDRPTATKAIQDLPRILKKIDLHWGSDLRVDPLTPDLAVVATSYTEVQTDPQGHQKTETGFFTGVAELRNSRWQFRDAHWSALVAPAKAP
jgi:hypothetical protein